MLIGMSTDYYARLEQARGPQPSEPMLAAIARGLRLSLTERDHLFVLGGHRSPRQAARSDHVDVGLMRILDRLVDTPAMVLSDLGETLVQTPPAVALFGDDASNEGFERAMVWRWFTDPAARGIYPAEDHDLRGRQLVADLRTASARAGRGSRAAEMVASLLDSGAGFAEVWADHEVRHRRTERKRFTHAEVGDLELYCQILLDPDQHQTLLVFTAEPGTVSDDRLRLLAVIGAQRVSSSGP